MRLSAELITNLCEQRNNPLNERELILRGLAIPAIEHLGVCRDSYDCIDFSDNRLLRLDNFPRMIRLSSLLCSTNLIDSVDSKNFATNIPNIKFLTLSYNNISTFYEISNIGKGCKKLEFLSLEGNPVTKRQHYRLYTIRHIPSLKVLDFVKIKPAERERAERLANSAAGAALENDVSIEAKKSIAKIASKNNIIIKTTDEEENSATTKTFIPGEGKSAEESFVINFTKEQKELIRQMVANANSPAEIEQIEQSVKRGILPNFPTSAAAAASQETSAAASTLPPLPPPPLPPPSSPPPEDDEDDQNNRKRPAQTASDDNGNDDNHIANGEANNKKIRRPTDDEE